MGSWLSLDNGRSTFFIADVFEDLRKRYRNSADQGNPAAFPDATADRRSATELQTSPTKEIADDHSLMHNNLGQVCRIRRVLLSTKCCFRHEQVHHRCRPSVAACVLTAGGGCAAACFPTEITGAPKKRDGDHRWWRSSARSLCGALDI
jgi:hypothetical protein